jgi:TPR repeat protein
MSSSGRNDATGSEGEVEEDTDAKIERLEKEIDELKASLIGVPEMSDEWFQIKTDIKDRDVERLLLFEKKRCDGVVDEYFKENPRVLEAAPECPVCLEKMWSPRSIVRFVCCGKLICKKCSSQGGDVFITCPLCRGKAPSPDEAVSITKEKADSGIAWAQADLGKHYLYGHRDVMKDAEKALVLLSEAAEKGSARAKSLLGEYYLEIENADYEEARRWHEAAAAEGELISLFQLGMMMKNGHAYGFDENEETRAEAFRLLTISATLLREHFKLAALELARFFRDSLPIALHYLRPAVEEGSADADEMNLFALGLVQVSIKYYGEKGVLAPGYNPVPEALFWYRRSNKARRPDDAGSPRSPFPLIEQQIREQCASCKKPLESERKMCCAECKAAYYCGCDCQMAHWKAGHKKDCVKRLKKKLKAAGTL